MIVCSLKDGTVVTLGECADEEFRWDIRMNGTLICRYSEFGPAWEDLGEAVRCDTYARALISF